MVNYINNITNKIEDIKNDAKKFINKLTIEQTSKYIKYGDFVFNVKGSISDINFLVNSYQNKEIFYNRIFVISCNGIEIMDVELSLFDYKNMKSIVNELKSIIKNWLLDLYLWQYKNIKPFQYWNKDLWNKKYNIKSIGINFENIFKKKGGIYNENIFTII